MGWGGVLLVENGRGGELFIQPKEGGGGVRGSSPPRPMVGDVGAGRERWGALLLYH